MFSKTLIITKSCNRLIHFKLKFQQNNNNKYFWKLKKIQDKENVGGSPEKVTDKTMVEEGKVHETSFSHIYRLLKQPHRLSAKMIENLSVSLAFLGKWIIKNRIFHVDFVLVFSLPYYQNIQKKC